MSGQHIVQRITRSDSDHTARCRCGWTPDPTRRYITKGMVEDEIRTHEMNVERARLAAKRGGGTLKSDLAHYEEMAANPNVPSSDRELWEQLADETRKRLGVEPGPDEQPSLFGMEK